MAESLVTVGAIAAIHTARRVALVCHQNPDSDCIGGMMALTHALRAMGKEAYPLSPDAVPDYLLHVPAANEIQAVTASLPAIDLVIAVEAASLERMEPVWSNAAAQLGGARVLNIDHHLSNTGFGDERIIDPTAAAVCETIYDVLIDLGATTDRTIAYCLLTGIIGDTRSFRTSSTTPHTLQVAGELIAAGAPLNQVSDAVHKYRSAAELGVWATVLGRARCEDGVLWTTMTNADAKRHGLSIDQIDGIVEFLSDTRDTAATVVFKVLRPGRIRVSMRSDGRVDLTQIAGRWGGGGHPQASGCTIGGTSLAAATEAVVGAIKQALHESAASAGE